MQEILLLFLYLNNNDEKGHTTYINKILSLENQFSDSQIIFEIEVSFFNPVRKLETQHSVSI